VFIDQIVYANTEYIHILVLRYISVSINDKGYELLINYMWNLTGKEESRKYYHNGWNSRNIVEYYWMLCI
jgi:hypothetical protein